MNNSMAQVMNMLKNSVNPLQTIMQLQNSNDPMLRNMAGQFQIAYNQMRQSGMSMEQFAKQYAKQNNINLQQVANYFGIKL